MRDVDLVPLTRGGLGLWQFPDTPPTLSLYVTSREGGVSTGAYAGLNLGDHVGDDPVAVAHNRALVRDALGLEISYLAQVHGNHIGSHGEQADGQRVVPGRGAAIMSADCLSVVIANEHEAVVVHAGWRGLANGVIAQGIATFESRPTVAYLGPSISTHAYEVSPELLEEHEDFPAHALTTGRKPHLDLRGVAATQLRRGGVSDIVATTQVTDGGDTFYSARAHNPTGRFALIAVRS